MAKLLAILFTVVAITACGSTGAATRSPVAPTRVSFHAAPDFHAAPVEGSPEEAAMVLGRGVPNSPAEGVPSPTGE